MAAEPSFRHSRRAAAVTAAALLTCLAAGASATHGRGPGRPDLRVAVRVERSPVSVGDTAVLHATVTNAGMAAARHTRVAVRLPRGLEARSVESSAGTCAAAPPSCSLGVLQSGDRAEITVRVLVSVASPLRVVVTSTSAARDSRPADNQARATVVGTPVGAIACVRLVFAGRTIPAGRTSRVRVRVAGPPPVAGRVVVAAGAGARASARTGANGVALLALTPRRRGTIALWVRGAPVCRVATLAAEP